MNQVRIMSSITCPGCGSKNNEAMPKTACQYFGECPNCRKVCRPQKGDCCVFCSYGDNPCPPVQQNNDCC